MQISMANLSGTPAVPEKIKAQKPKLKLHHLIESVDKIKTVDLWVHGSLDHVVG
jgi:hypothetical protein